MNSNEGRRNSPPVALREGIATRARCRWIPRGWAWMIGHPRLWYVGFALQAVAMSIGAEHELRDFILTHDFAGYWQAVWWMGARHRAFPSDTVFGWPFLANAGEWVMWPIGFVGYTVWPHPSLLLAVQAAALLGAEILAWQWIADESRGWAPAARFLFLGIAMINLAANPWILKSDFTDFHSECILALATVGAAWALSRQRWLALGAWVVFALSCGTVGALAVIGLAGSAALLRRWRAMAGCGAAGLVTLMLLSQLHLDQGSLMAQSYHYLLGSSVRQVTPWAVISGLVHHPERAARALWGHGSHLLENWIGSVGLGWGNLSALGPIFILTLVNNLVQPNLGTHFGAPGFQSVMLYPLMTVGAMTFLLRWGRSKEPWRRRGMVAALTLMLSVNMSLFAWTWPHLWLPPRTSVGQRLTEIVRRVPVTEEVIASQGIVGRFAGRPWVYSIMQRQRFPVHTETTVVLLTPSYSYHVLSTQQQDAEVVDLQRDPQARLVSHQDGVWWFEVRRTGRTLFLPDHRSRSALSVSATAAKVGHVVS